MSGAEAREPVPLWARDGMDDAEAAAGSLAQAVRCARTAVRCSGEDCEAYIDGTLDVLLLAAEDAHAKIAGLRDEAEGKVG